MKCGVVIPGVGPCEVEGRHDLDGRGWPIHRRGACSWNGDDPNDYGEGKTRQQEAQDSMYVVAGGMLLILVFAAVLVALIVAKKAGWI